MDREIKTLLDKTLPKALRYAELENLLTYPEIVADKMYFLNLEKEKRTLEKCVELRNKLVQAVENFEFYVEYAKSEKENLEDQIKSKEQQIIEYAQQLKLMLVDIADDEENALIEIICDKQFDEQINKIVEQYCVIAQKFNLEYEYDSDKNISLKVVGKGAYSLFKKECGAYRIKANGVKSNFAVIVSVMNDEPYIDPKDIKFELFHSSGAGGQNVNKVETAVRARYIPTGEAVACQDERSQLQNKERAFALLVEKLTKQQLNERKLKKDKLLKSVINDKNKGIYKREYDFDKNTLKIKENTMILSENLDKIILGV